MSFPFSRVPVREAVRLCIRAGRRGYPWHSADASAAQDRPSIGTLVFDFAKDQGPFDPFGAGVERRGLFGAAREHRPADPSGLDVSIAPAPVLDGPHATLLPSPHREPAADGCSSEKRKRSPAFLRGEASLLGSSGRDQAPELDPLEQGMVHGADRRHSLRLTPRSVGPHHDRDARRPSLRMSGFAYRGDSK